MQMMQVQMIQRMNLKTKQFHPIIPAVFIIIFVLLPIVDINSALHSRIIFSSL